MGLQATIAKAVDTAFKAAGDLVGPFTLRKRASSFTPVGAVTTVVTTDYTLTGVFEDVFDSNSGLTVVGAGKRVLWAKSSVSTDPSPETNDLIIGPDSTEYKIGLVTKVASYGATFLYRLELST